MFFHRRRCYFAVSLPTVRVLQSENRAQDRATRIGGCSHGCFHVAAA